MNYAFTNRKQQFQIPRSHALIHTRVHPFLNSQRRLAIWKMSYLIPYTQEERGSLRLTFNLLPRTHSPLSVVKKILTSLEN